MNNNAKPFKKVTPINENIQIDINIYILQSIYN